MSDMSRLSKLSKYALWRDFWKEAGGLVSNYPWSILACTRES